MITVKFTQEELLLIYRACKSYEDKLEEIILSDGKMNPDDLGDRLKDIHSLVRKVYLYIFYVGETSEI